MLNVDARGKACPAPVLETKKILEKEGGRTIRVVVDNPASQENVKRFLESQGFAATIQEKDGDFFIFGAADKDADISNMDMDSPLDDASEKKIMVMCATDRMGYGDDELGKKLMISFLKTIGEMGGDLWCLAFVNNGVKLAVEASPVLQALSAYEENGLRILVCGTCLTHFNLLEAKKVGETTNMLDIVTSMQVADSVIQF